MKWLGDDLIYLEEKSKEFRKYLKRLNNIKRKVNSNGHFRYVCRQSYNKDRFDR